MSFPPCNLKLNEYTIALSEDELNVEGPDKEVARHIGERFLELIQTDEGFGLLAKTTVCDDAENLDDLWVELIERLGVPPCE